MKTKSSSALYSKLHEDLRPIHQSGFLLIIPHPVTDYDVVYTALKRFLEILQQIDQKYLPIACDEGVDKIVRHIIFTNEKEF